MFDFATRKREILEVQCFILSIEGTLVAQACKNLSKIKYQFCYKKFTSCFNRD